MRGAGRCPARRCQPGQPPAAHPFPNNASFGAYAEVVRTPAYRDDKPATTLNRLPDLLRHLAAPFTRRLRRSNSPSRGA